LILISGEKRGSFLSTVHPGTTEFLLLLSNGYLQTESHSAYMRKKEFWTKSLAVLIHL